jgi:MFS transporter, PAT family, beta-lactamase induction signal transducer AmpG
VPERSRFTPPPVFALTMTPFAAAVGWVTVAAPYWLARDGASLAAIGAMSGTAMLPHALKVFWAPLLDLGGRRRAWYVACTLGTAAALLALALLPDPANHLPQFTLLATVLQILGTTASAAADGLMAVTTAPDAQGRASGWRMAGNGGGTGVFGALGLWIGGAAGVPVAGLAVAALVAVSALAGLLLREPQAARRVGSMAGALAANARAMARDLWGTVRSRLGWTGLVICAVPVGAGALTNLFSAMALEYRASENLVAQVNGLAGGIVGAAGSFAGGWLADHMRRRLAYAASGALLAACALAMAAAPLTPFTYGWGTLAYNFATGVAFAALAALVLELVGDSVAATTKYTLFISVANLASSYVTWIDGAASEVRGAGARGSLLADALLTILGIGVLLALALATRPARAADPARAA